MYLNVDITFVTPNAVRKKERDVPYLTILSIAKVIWCRWCRGEWNFMWRISVMMLRGGNLSIFRKTWSSATLSTTVPHRLAYGRKEKKKLQGGRSGCHFLTEHTQRLLYKGLRHNAVHSNISLWSEAMQSTQKRSVSRMQFFSVKACSTYTMLQGLKLPTTEELLSWYVILPLSGTVNFL